MVFHLYHIFHKVTSLPREIKLKKPAIFALEYLFCCCLLHPESNVLLTSEMCIPLSQIVNTLYVLTCERRGCEVAWIRTYLGLLVSVNVNVLG